MSIDEEIIQYDVSMNELELNNHLLARYKINPKINIKRILWFIPLFKNINKGGINTIFKFAQYFSEKEQIFNIIVLYGKEKKIIKDHEEEIKKAFPKLKFTLLYHRFSDDVNNLPVSDVAICTLWNSAYLLVKYNLCKVKYYFIQDFEPSFYAAGSVYGLVEQTYRFGFGGIANTPGVLEHYKKYNNWAQGFIPGIDTSNYYPKLKKAGSKKSFRIVFYGRPNNQRNGFRLGIESLKKVKSYFGDKVEIISVGDNYSLKDYNLENVVTNLGFIENIHVLANLYRTCDIGLVFMFTPHPSYQPLEYMASGCITVTNFNENNLWLLKHNENAILSEPTISCVSQRIINLIENEKLQKKLINGGLNTVKSLKWENEFEKVLQFIKNPKL